MESISIQGVKREALGKKSTKAVRRAGDIPCVVYGGSENIHFTTKKLGVRDLIYSADFKTVDIAMGDQAVKCILKSVVFHPVTDEITHMDFLELVPGKEFKAEVPIRFTGEAPGVKIGGKLTQKLRRAKIKVKPENLVDALFVDISALELGSSVRVSEIQPVDGIVVMNYPGIPIASVEVPRALKGAGAEEEEGGEGGITSAATEPAEAAAAE